VIAESVWIGVSNEYGERPGHYQREKRMNIEKAIVDGGTEAVRRYRAVAGLRQDNEIPEVFLGSIIACRIYDDLQLHAHLEHLYTDVVKSFGIEITPQIYNLMNGYEADVAAYDGRKPLAAIELKVFDETTSYVQIVSDRDKLLKLTGQCRVEAYLGVLVTDTQRQECVDRIRLLGERLGRDFDLVGEEQRSISEKWNWRFAVARVA
jgi:hypothetical protein